MTIWILSLRDECELFHGSGEEALGWCAPLYGPVVPTSVVRLRRVATAPLDFVTVIVETPAEPTLEEITGAPAREGAIRFSLGVAGRIHTVHFARQPGQPDGGTSDGFDRHTLSVERVR